MKPLHLTNAQLILAISTISTIRQVREVRSMTPVSIDLTLVAPALTSRELTRINRVIGDFSFELDQPNADGECQLYLVA